MSLVRQVADQPAGVAVVTAGQHVENCRSISAAVEAAEMKGPQSERQRLETTGSSEGDLTVTDASGRTSRSAGGCPAAAQTVL